MWEGLTQFLTLWCMIFIDMIVNCFVLNGILVVFSYFVFWVCLLSQGVCHCLHFVEILGPPRLFRLFPNLSFEGMGLGVCSAFWGESISQVFLWSLGCMRGLKY